MGGRVEEHVLRGEGRSCFLSHHIGDMENYETNRSFREGIEHYCGLFDVSPEVVACDLHPEYLATKYAREREEEGMRVIAVQHHHAHIAACLAENERPDDERVIGVALDGTGWGTDGAIWGGEFLEGSIRVGFVRRAHLRYMPLPGGDAAIRQPWRMAVAQLVRLYGEDRAACLPNPAVRLAGDLGVRQIARMMENRLNTPPTSSAGRLFDIVAALIGLPGTRQVTYEGQAAIELEIAASRCRVPTRSYPARLWTEGECGIIDTDAILTGVVDDVLAARPPPRPPRASIGRWPRSSSGSAWIRAAGDWRLSPAVALSGGVWQNTLLLALAAELLTEQGFAVYRHRRVPPNDGGLCLGQAVLANAVTMDADRV